MPGFATLADVHAFEQVPLSERDLPRSTYEALARAADAYDERPALRFFVDAAVYDQPVEFSFRELLEAVHRAANLFHDLDIDGEEVVSVLLPNLPETHFVLWGASTAGVVNPVNPLLEPSQIAEILHSAGTRVLVTLAPFPGTDLWEKVESVLPRVPSVHTVLRVHLADYVPGARRPPAAPIPGGARVLELRDEMEKHPADRLVGGRMPEPGDAAAYFHTGGTTGHPRLARQTHANQVFDAWATAVALDVRPGQVFFCGLPLFHVNGVLVTGLVPWSRGGCVVLGTPQGFRGPGVVSAFWKVVEHYGVNFFSGVPTIYSALLDAPIGDADVGSLRFALCGAAPMPVEVFREFEARTGVRILEGYGLTEGTCVSCVNPLHGDRRVGSVGLRLPYQEVRTVALDADGGARESGPGEIGHVAIRGPNVFAGYRGMDGAADTWIPDPEGGSPWLRTGDLGRLDPDGYLWLTGRSKELIIRSGHNIDPQVVEGPLHEHPAVALAAAVGRPDPRAGEVVVAYVQLKPGAEAGEEDLLRFAEARIGERAAIPKRVHVVERIPLTAVGKIFKPQLRWQEAGDVYREVVEALPGVHTVRAEGGPHPIHGTRVRLRVEAEDSEALREAVRHALGRYTIAYEVEFGA